MLNVQALTKATGYYVFSYMVPNCLFRYRLTIRPEPTIPSFALIYLPSTTLSPARRVTRTPKLCTRCFDVGGSVQEVSLWAYSKMRGGTLSKMTISVSSWC
jgi:hypothetical protein